MNRKSFLKQTGLATLGLYGAANLLIPFKSKGNSMHRISKNWAWITDEEGTVDDWKRRLETFKKAGFDAILPQNRFDTIIPAAEANDIEVHAWLVSLQRSSDGQVQKEHPEWFNINRNGESSLEKPAYVEYYKWLCPSREQVHDYMISQAEQILQYSEIKSVHLDYIRYPDVILPIQLQPKYNIVQDKEYPEYDYCYCRVCREKFKDKHGIDPMEIEDPASHKEWLQYRYDQVTTLVNKLALRVHQENRMLTAAVFPTPEIARTLVRQNWPDWDLDAVLPMMYHNFYHKNVEWIGRAVKECRRELPKTTPLYSGIFVPEMDEVEIAQAFEFAMEAGADGISLFTDTAMTDAHWEHVRRVIQRG